MAVSKMSAWRASLRSLYLLACFLQVLIQGQVFEAPQKQAVFLRSRRANMFLVEEIFQGNLERECYEELCSHEEAREYFEDDDRTNAFWTIYKDGDQCAPPPCLHGGSCTDKVGGFHCSCPPPLHGAVCELGGDGDGGDGDGDGGDRDGDGGDGDGGDGDGGDRDRGHGGDGGDGDRGHGGDGDGGDGDGGDGDGGDGDGGDGAPPSLPQITAEMAECPTGGPTACHQLCTASYRSFSCSCTEGFRLQADGRSCVPEVAFPCGRLPDQLNATAASMCRHGNCPWQVTLMSSGGAELCGGVVLGRRSVLTAARCLRPDSGSDLRPFHFAVVAGGEGEERVVVPVRALYVHSRFRTDHHDNDLALLELVRPLTFGPALIHLCLPNKDFAENILMHSGRTGAVATRTGVTRRRGGGRTHKPVYMTLDECRRQVNVSHPLSNKMFCMKRQNGAGRAQRSPNGPLGSQNGVHGSPYGPLRSQNGVQGNPNGPLGNQNGTQKSPNGPLGNQNGTQGNPNGHTVNHNQNPTQNGMPNEANEAQGRLNGVQGNPNGPLGNQNGTQESPNGPLGNQNGTQGNPNGHTVNHNQNPTQNGMPNEANGAQGSPNGHTVNPNGTPNGAESYTRSNIRNREPSESGSRLASEISARRCGDLLPGTPVATVERGTAFLTGLLISCDDGGGLVFTKLSRYLSWIGQRLEAAEDHMTPQVSQYPENR